MLQLVSTARLSKEHNSRGPAVVTIFTWKYNNAMVRERERTPDHFIKFSLSQLQQ